MLGPGECDAHDVSCAWIERGGFEIEAEALLLEQLGDQGSALGFGLDERVAVLDLVDGLGLGGGSKGQLVSGSGTRRPFVHVLTFTDRASLVATGELAAATGLEVTAEQAFAERVELELNHHRFQRFLVIRLTLQLIEGHLHGCVGHDGDELLREQGLLRVQLYLFSELAFDFVGIGDGVLDAAPGLHQRGGGLLAHAGNARHVVHRIAHQALHIDHLVNALHAPAREHFRHAKNLRITSASARLVDADMLADELAEVLVRRDHPGVQAFGFSALGECADDVIRLPAIFDQDGNPHGRAEPLDLRNGADDVLRRFLALGLVGGEHLMARCGSRGVQCDRQVRGLLRLGDVQQRVGEAVERRRVHAITGHDGCTNEGKVRAVKQRHAIEKIEPAGHARTVAVGGAWSMTEGAGEDEAAFTNYGI